MKSATTSANAFSAPTKSFEKIYGEAGATTSREPRCPVLVFEDYSAPLPPAPAKYSSISDLVSEWERDANGRKELKEGREWVAGTFYANDGDTVRTLRLRKGWSQAQLAAELATSQSHIARIERGTENLSIDTCRKLSRALGIDLNTLDQALKRQELVARGKQK